MDNGVMALTPHAPRHMNKNRKMVMISYTELRVSQKFERLKAPSESLDSPSEVDNIDK